MIPNFHYIWLTNRPRPLLFPVGLRVEMVHVHFFMIVWHHRLLAGRQGLGQGVGHGRLDGLGEGDAELDYQPALLERVPVGRHALAENNLEVARLDYLA